MATLSAAASNCLETCLSSGMVNYNEILTAVNNVGTLTSTLSGKATKAIAAAVGDRRTADAVATLLATSNGGTLTGWNLRRFKIAFPGIRGREILARINNDTSY